MGHNNQPARLLTIPEVAERCQLSERTVNRAILAGELRAFKLRSRWRIHPDDVAAWIDAASPEPPVAGHRRASRTIHRHRESPHSLRRLFDDDNEVA